CLTTRRPDPATAKAAIVVMFTVWARSPPVPTMSTARSPSGTRVAWASIVSTSPVSSLVVSPLARNSTMNAASCAGVAAPLMISSIAPAVSAADSASPRMSAPSTAGQVFTAPSGEHSSHDRNAGDAVAQLLGHHFARCYRIQRLGDHAVGERPVRKPLVVLSRDQDDQRGAVVDLVLELPRHPHAPRGLRLAVKEPQVAF